MVEEAVPGSGPLTLQTLRVELTNTTNNWDRTWQLARMKNLGPDLTTFMFKLLHQILPTAERVARILPKQTPLCTRCNEDAPETIHHAMLECNGNQDASTTLLVGLKLYITNLTPTMVLTLDYDIEESLQFPLVWITASFLSSLWQLRQDKKKVELIKIRADLEANCRLLRESRLTSTTEVLNQIFQYC